MHVTLHHMQEARVLALRQFKRFCTPRVKPVLRDPAGKAKVACGRSPGLVGSAPETGIPGFELE